MKINTNIAKLAVCAGSLSQFPSDRIPQIAFSGRSNVGKSSLINTLLSNRSLARVSSAPGKTVTINFFSVDSKLYFVDLPGYGYAKRSYEGKAAWSSLTDSYFSGNKNADAIKLVCQLIDVRVGPTDDDIMMINYLIEKQMPFIVVMTKADKYSKTALVKRVTEINDTYFKDTDIPYVAFSSVSKEGKDVLWCKILESIEK